jgi:hypothetical protein
MRTLLENAGGGRESRGSPALIHEYSAIFATERDQSKQGLWGSDLA